MKKSILVLLLLCAVGCAKKDEAPAPSPSLSTSAAPALSPSLSTSAAPALSPSETVLKVCDALAGHDSAAYISMVSSTRRRTYAANPQLLSRTLAFWWVHKPTIQILSESQHGTTAMVTYRLKIAGTRPVDVKDSTQLLLENGAWKYAH